MPLNLRPTALYIHACQSSFLCSMRASHLQLVKDLRKRHVCDYCYKKIEQLILVQSLTCYYNIGPVGKSDSFFSVNMKSFQEWSIQSERGGKDVSSFSVGICHPSHLRAAYQQHTGLCTWARLLSSIPHLLSASLVFSSFSVSMPHRWPTVIPKSILFLQQMATLVC